MKKIIAIMLAAMLLLTFCACNGGGANGSAYSFSYKGQKLVIDAEAKATLDAIGAPISSQELGTCGIGDKDKLFVYSDFRVMTYQMEGVDYFYQIELLTDQVATEEGVAIGDTQQKVTDTYGEPTERDVSVFTYAAKGVNLVIHFDESSHVKSILYMRAE